VLLQSYLTGAHPPAGRALDILSLRNAALNYIIAYPAAYDALVEGDVQDADGDGRPTFIGNAVVGSAALPKDPDDAADVAAAGRLQYLVNTWMMDAWTEGRLDANVDGDVEDADAIVPEGVYAEQLAGRLDYVGLNYYSTLRVIDCPGIAALAGSDPEARKLAETVGALPELAPEPGTPVSENGLRVDAPGFLETLRVYEPYTHGPGGITRPILVMENGHGDCDDDQRAKYLAEHFVELARAVEEGIPVSGYMLWSLTDNFEWDLGRDQCFGLYRVDYDADFERTPTRSVELYRETIRRRGVDAELLETYAAGRYPTDCNALPDDAERQACIEALPPNPAAELQALVGGVCGS
jgi:beta-glucosidase/6-phospho-beta-glucosidase/beta-galactosidase